MTQTGEWTGVDIAKRFLDVHAAGEPPFRLANDADGRAALAERLRALGVRGVVLEATGGLERPVLAALIAAGVPASIVNPARVRAFAEGTGQLAKTDRIDAKVLAAYGAYMQPPPSALPSSARAKLRELLGYRAQIGEEITARCAQLKLYASDSLKVRAQAALDALRRERRELEREIEALIDSTAELAQPFRILTSVPAVGKRLRAKGKPGKVALVAAMHKLLTILNAMLRSGRTWRAIAQPKPQT